MRYPPTAPTQSEDFRTAVRRFELGLYHNAGAQFAAILQQDPTNTAAREFLLRVQRKLSPRPTAPATLVWQFDPAGAWESEWLRTLLGGEIGREIVDNTWSIIADPMIVVDNRLVAEKVPYYRQAFEQGARIILVHLSDEAFRDDLGAYRYCEAVLRNYHSDVLAEHARIRFFPLGCKSGFVNAGVEPKPAAQRRHLWSFAGDVKKLTRAEMIAAMRDLDGGVWHLIDGFGTADSLSTPDYRALLDDTVIVPCPGGWSNLETFRVYEALEAGCIPIVECRPGFDYFTTLLGPHPIPTVMQWTDAPTLIRGWQARGEVEDMRRQCSVWWTDYKPKLTADLQAAIVQALGSEDRRPIV